MVNFKPESKNRVTIRDKSIMNVALTGNYILNHSPGLQNVLKKLYNVLNPIRKI